MQDSGEGASAQQHRRFRTLVYQFVQRQRNLVDEGFGLLAVQRPMPNDIREIKVILQTGDDALTGHAGAGLHRKPEQRGAALEQGIQTRG